MSARNVTAQNVPPNWDVRRLKSICSLAYGDSLPDAERSNGEIPVYGSNGKIGTHFVSNTDGPSIVIGRKGSFGKVHFSEQPAFAIDTTYFVDRNYTHADLRWLFYLLASSGLDTVSRDSAIPGLNRDDAYRMAYPYPPPEEQAAIVRYLDHADELINRYTSTKERLIDLLEEQRQAVIHQAVTRGYDPDVPLKPSHVTNVPLMPAHWEIKRLKSVAHIRYGLGQPPRESPNGLPLIRATNVSRGHITENAMMYVDPYDVPTTRDAFLRENEIIVVRSGAYTADSAIIPKRYEGAISGYDMVVAATEANPEFLAMALLSTYVRDDQLIVVSNRAAQPHLNAEELGDAKIITPPRPEQEAIVNYLHHRLTEVANAKERAHRQIDLMHEYRTRLIADVVTGQIDVRDAAVVLSD